MNVGVLGLGIMGGTIAEKLIACGQNVFIWSRTKSRAATLLEAGAQWRESPLEVAEETEVVFSCVPDSAAVSAVALGPGGVRAGISETSVYCDMSTIAPSAAAYLQAAFNSAGRRFVHAPVLGSKKQIASGELLVFAGGAIEDIQACERAWRCFASRAWEFDTAERAATTKLACNMLISQMILALGQSLLFAKQGGVDPYTLLEILDSSALGAPMFAKKGKTLIQRDFSANFFVTHMLKDLMLAAEAARLTGTPLPLNAIARELYLAADAQGLGYQDYSAVVQVLEQLAGAKIAE